MIIFALAVSLAACGSNQDSSDTSEPSMPPGTVGSALAGEWNLSEGVPIVEGRPITLTVEPVQFTGTAACNSYTAGYTSSGGVVEIGGITRTEIGCEPDVMESESAYFDALARVTSMTVDGDRLLLTGDGVELVFERV